jgi:hypothetical protein
MRAAEACCATSCAAGNSHFVELGTGLREGQIAASATTKMKEVHDLAEPMRARLDAHAAGHFRATGRTSSKSVATSPR